MKLDSKDAIRSVALCTLNRATAVEFVGAEATGYDRGVLLTW